MHSIWRWHVNKPDADRTDSTIPAVTTLPCPRCGQPARWAPDNPARPFCSERCKLIDLGAWATESHRIPGDPVPPQDDE
ncbi:MAG TPA: DNA gyrase inhibitor YacG [Moraxellaceae bacterium]|nr:DNA gyrase inhibitor YacG [Moraxellaceae bacterium]